MGTGSEATSNADAPSASSVAPAAAVVSSLLRNLPSRDSTRFSLFKPGAGVTTSASRCTYAAPAHRLPAKRAH